MISRGGGVGYVELAALLRERITSGVLAPGARFPSENDLANEHGISLTTVRRAVRELSDEGLIVVRHGYATRVRADEPTTEVAIQRGARFTVRMPTPEERAELNIPRGVPVVEVQHGASKRVYPADRHTFTCR